MSVASQYFGPSSRGSAADAELDLPALGAALWRKKWRILSPAIFVGMLTLVAVQMITPRYLSEARVFIEGRDNIYLRPDLDKDTMDRGAVDQEAVTSQAQIILSRDLAREVIEKLKLGELPEFDPTLAGISPIKAVLGMIGLVKNPFNMTKEERVLDAYYERLSVTPVEKSRIINIDFLSEDPELAARVANAVADAYLERQRQAKQEQARSAGQWLAGEIESMRRKVAEAEAKVEAFRAKSNLFIGNNNTTLSAQGLGDFNTQLAAARAQKADAESKARIIRDMLKSGQAIQSPDVLNSELIRRLSEQRVTLRAQLAEQSTTLMDGHPRIKELRAQIADLDRQILEEADKIARSFENEAKLASSRVEALVASFDQLKSQAANTNEQDIQLRALEREAKSQRDLLESYLAKYREATSRDTANSSPADARVVSRATVSNIPAYPKKLPTVLIATFTTLVLGIGFVLTRELLSMPGGAASAPVSADSNGAEVPPARIAAVVGEHHHAAYGVGAPLTAVDHVANTLRTAGRAGGRIAVFAAVPGSGTSHTALKLGRALAAEASAILVSLSPKDSAIKATAKDPSASGLAELAAGAASFRDVITKDVHSGLHLISSGWVPADRAKILAAPGIPTSFDALARSYRHVIVDAGDIVASELEAIADIAPHAVLVAETQANAATSAARENLLAAGFDDVTDLVGVRADSPAETAAAA
jgi:polysaccharide biosynthesis transport protein